LTDSSGYFAIEQPHDKTRAIGDCGHPQYYPQPFRPKHGLDFADLNETFFDSALVVPSYNKRWASAKTSVA
jgi:hypothetical protein